MLRLFLLYALSGFVSLGYQVSWFRIFTDWFGSTNLTFALVVCCFIGGLGLGAYVSEAVTNGIARGLKTPGRMRVYGIVELLVSATALLTLFMAYLPPDLWGVFPYQEVGGIWVKGMTYEVGQAMVAIVCVSLPCFFMGITFPLLCNAFLGTENSGRLPALLYAWNTLGACSGVLACQFLFLPLIGHNDAFILMVILNAALGLYFVITSGGSELAALSGRATGVSQGVAATAEPSTTATRSVALLFTAAILSGLVAGSLEGDMFKRISFVIANNPGATMSAISFWAILGIFLGSVAVRVLPRLNLNHIKFAYLLAIVCYWVVWQYGYEVINNFEFEYARIRDTQTLDATPPIAMFPSSLGQLFLYVGVYVFPAFLLISFLLPWVCNHLQTDRKHLGRAYGLNTLAFCLGMIGFTLLAPMVSIFYSLKLIFVLLICGALLLQLMQEDSKLGLWKPGLTIIAFAVAAYFVPGDFDRDYVTPNTPQATNRVTAMKSNGAVTSFVVDKRGSKILFFGNVSMSGTTRGAQTYMRLMAHFPLLAQANPTKALLICFGVGNTASAITAHDTIEQLDIVDLNRRVFETAPEFSATNRNAQLDPRVRLINDDGRSYLSITDEKYDLITSEPPPPMAAGVYRLYSREYYHNALEHLTSSGMMTQWLPYYQMPPEGVARAVKSFIDVFPHSLLISGRSEELILVGSAQPINLETIQERFRSMPGVLQDLKDIVVNEPVDLFVRIMQTDAELRENYSDSGIISDQNNHLEQMFPGWGRIPEISYDPVRVLTEVGKEYPQIAAEMRPIVTQLGRLQFRDPDFPLYQVRPNPAVKYSDADWKQITRLSRSGLDLLDSGRQAEGIKKFIQVLRIAPEHALMLSFVGQVYANNHQSVDAENAFRRLALIEPGNATVAVWLAQAIADQGRGREAIAQYRKALNIDPDDEDGLRGLARLLATYPGSAPADLKESLTLAERARAQSGETPAVLNALAAAYAANNRFTEAVQVAEQARGLAVVSKAEIIGKMTRGELVLYRNHSRFIDPTLIK